MNFSALKGDGRAQHSGGERERETREEGHMRSLRPSVVAPSGTKQRSLGLVVGCDWSPLTTCHRSLVRDNETNIFYDHYEAMMICSWPVGTFMGNRSFLPSSLSPSDTSTQ